MFFSFFETLIRMLITLAQASWRRMPSRRWKKLIWLYGYLKWSLFMTALMVFAPRRGTLFTALYAWFRPADDILDGEDPHPPSHMKAYIQEKGALIALLSTGKLMLSDVHAHDRLLVTILQYAQSLGIEEEIQRYVPLMWKHMVDEYTWRTSCILPTAQELETFACSQDEAIFRLAALVLGANHDALGAIDFDRLGVFTRTDWICDLPSDLSIGQVHLSREVCEEYDLTHQALMSVNLKYSARLRIIIRDEIRKVDVLWRQVYSQREVFAKAFPYRFMGRLYNYMMLEEIEWHFEKVRKVYF